MEGTAPMTRIFASFARMALLAVPFADPLLSGMIETSEEDALRARDNGDAGDAGRNPAPQQPSARDHHCSQ